MKKRLSILGTAALAACMMIPAQMMAQAPAAGPQGGQSAPRMGGMQRRGMGRNGAGRNERHPAIRQAIKALERAKDDLQRANHDFGGHRDEAVEAVNNAIAQLQKALNYDKK